MNKLILLDTTTDKPEMVAHFDYMYELENELIKKDLPKSWEVLDMSIQMMIADNVNGIYDA